MTLELPRGRTLQWILVAAWMSMFVVLMIMDLHHSEDARRPSPWGCAAGFISALAHGMWISLDCRILNRPVGAWRFGGFFLGPLAVWLYLAVAYRVHALWMIPVSFLIYLVPLYLLMIEFLVRTGPVTI